MTWNPLKLRRLIRHQDETLKETSEELRYWHDQYWTASHERDALAAEIARLKSPPRGDRVRFVGRGH